MALRCFFLHPLQPARLFHAVDCSFVIIKFTSLKCRFGA